MRRFFPPGVVAFAGVLGIATGSVQVGDSTSGALKKQDSRAGILRKFLKEKGSPVSDFATVFVAEADYHGLDWRLLPSLAFVESGAGKRSKNNNIFGWDNGRSRYATIGQAIHEVASALSINRAYRGKSVEAKLSSYNQSETYGPLVQQVMRQIYPKSQVEPAR